MTDPDVVDEWLAEAFAGLLLLSSEAPLPAVYEGHPTAPRNAGEHGGLARLDPRTTIEEAAGDARIKLYTLDVAAVPDLTFSSVVLLPYADGGLFAVSVGFAAMRSASDRDEQAVTLLAEPDLDEAALYPVRAPGTPREAPQLPEKVDFLPSAGVVIQGPNLCAAYWREGSSVYSIHWHLESRNRFESACRSLAAVG